MLPAAGLVRFRVVRYELENMMFPSPVAVS